MKSPDYNSWKNQMLAMPEYCDTKVAAFKLGLSEYKFKQKVKQGDLKGLRYLKLGTTIRYELKSLDEVKKRTGNEL